MRTAACTAPVNTYGVPAFSEDIPSCVEDCQRFLYFDAKDLLALKGVPWPEWNARMYSLVAELANACGCDSDKAWDALDRVNDDYPSGYEAMSEEMEELDTWLALTMTSTPIERSLEEEERCSEMVETLELREQHVESHSHRSDTYIVELARARLLRHGIRHPSAKLLSPVDADWLHRSANLLEDSLGEGAAAIYLQARCAALLSETQSRIEAMVHYWSGESGSVYESHQRLDWRTALQNLPTEQRKLMKKTFAGITFLLLSIASPLLQASAPMPVPDLVRTWATSLNKPVIWEAGNGYSGIMVQFQDIDTSKPGVFVQAFESLNALLEKEGQVPLQVCIFSNALVVRLVTQPACDKLV